MMDRRTVVQSAALASMGLVSAPLVRSAEAPRLLRGGRPELTHGVASGDPESDGAVIWARADRVARMVVEVGTTGNFQPGKVIRGPVLGPDTDFTGKVDLRGLPAGRELFYRVRLEDPDRQGVAGDALTGRLVTAPTKKTDIRFCWSGDVCGQGWGLNPDLDGVEIYDSMRALRPDFFLHSGDSVYADGPLERTVELPDGRVWKNIVTEPKSKVAETLDEFRGQWAYNLLDRSIRRFAADVPQIGQWDDHEVLNNWYPGEIHDDPRYTERDVDVLAARARRAFFEWSPIRERQRDQEGRIYRKISYGPLLDIFVLDMRTYKDANTDGTERVPDGGVLGWRQLAWLTRGLLRSGATWKVIASDLPIGLIVPDGDTTIEGIAQGLNGKPRGRELELAGLLSTLRRHGVGNVVWLTTDVHYTAAHHYAPERASYTDFDPFWEFVSGPLNAGGFGPNELDSTFGPKAMFVRSGPENSSPLDGFQHFGEVAISSDTGELTVRLRDQASNVLYAKTLTPKAF